MSSNNKVIAQMQVNHLKAMSEDDLLLEFQNSPRVQSITGEQYSVFNTLLILRQNSHATVLGGYKQWRIANRQVNKGQKGIYIWIPGKDKDDENKVFFFLAPVFDISQTSEDPSTVTTHSQS